MKYGERPKAARGVVKWKEERSKRPAPIARGAEESVRAQSELRETPPFFVQGQKASDLEWRVYRALVKLGWQDEIDFQVDVFGGRRVPGGQVLDFVVSGFGRAAVIMVNGDYWHGRTAATQQKDLQNEAFVRSVMPMASFLAYYSGDLADDETTYRRLARDVGRG